MFFVLFSLFVSMSGAKATPLSNFQDFSYEGSGCPVGTVGHVFSFDRKNISILFDQMIVSLSGNQKGREVLVEKDCRIFLNIKVKKNTRVNALNFKFDYRGYVYATNGGSAFLKVDRINRNSSPFPTLSNQSYQSILDLEWNSSAELLISEDFYLYPKRALRLETPCSKKDQVYRIELLQTMGAQLPAGHLVDTEVYLGLDSIEGVRRMDLSLVHFSCGL